MNKEELRKSLDFVNEERERLKKENDKWWAIIKDNEKEITQQLLENIELEHRIEKAIEYIEKKVICFKQGNLLCELNVDDLLNILRGKDNE